MIPDIETLRENWDCEVKLAIGKDGKGELPKSFWETYSAMANTTGGYIYLGVKEESSGSFSIQGIQDSDRILNDLWNLLSNREKVSVCLLKKEDVRVFPTPDHKNYVVIHIPKANRLQRPVYINNNPFNSYIRRNEGDHRCSEAEVKRMLAEANTVAPLDSSPLAGFGPKDLNSETIQAYKNRLASKNPNHPFFENH